MIKIISHQRKFILRFQYASLDVTAKTNTLPAYIRYIYQVMSIIYLVSHIFKNFSSAFDPNFDCSHSVFLFMKAHVQSRA
jgi:hypothetical protein